jgi:hypothetical protein
MKPLSPTYCCTFFSNASTEPGAALSSTNFRDRRLSDRGTQVRHHLIEVQLGTVQDSLSRESDDLASVCKCFVALLARH